MRNGLFGILAIVGWLAADAAWAHEGWPRDDVVASAERLLGTPVELTAAEALPPNLFLLDPTEEASCFVSPGDTISIFPAGEFAQVALIGDTSTVRTVWVYFPVLGVRDGDAAFAFFKGFFEQLLPGWPQAGTWAETSLSESWERGAAAYQDPMISFIETMPRATVDGVLLATMGIPPDLVTYRLTTRAECEKVSDFLLAKPRRASCDPERVHPEDAFRQVLLHHARPQPADRSETPFFLGQVSAQAHVSENLEFDLPAGLGSAGGLNWDAWIPRQMQGELELEQIVSEDWLCASHFTYLISSPDIAAPASPWLLSVESVSAYVTRAGDDIAYDPQMVSGLLFSKAEPTLPPRPPSLEPPYLLVGEGTMVFENEGDATPVDIGDVPLQFGHVSIRYGRTTFPDHMPMDGRLEGLSLILTSRSTGASTTADLGAWLDRQTGVAPAADRARPISNPALDLDLDGRRFRLVVTAADFALVDGDVSGASGFGGQLFGAP